MGVIVEVCVDNPAGLAAALDGGADRIELCSALELGGLTPSPGFMSLASGSPVPVMAMIRPRSGDFAYSGAEISQMCADIAAARAARLGGVVFGASRADGRLDEAALQVLLDCAAGLDCTLHRAFDLVPDPEEALNLAIRLGFRRILTSGGAGRAADGATRIAALVQGAAGRIGIMAGAGVAADNAAGLVALGVRELHGSCARVKAQEGRVVDLGFGPPHRRQTDADLVRALKAAVH